MAIPLSARGGRGMVLELTVECQKAGTLTLDGSGQPESATLNVNALSCGARASLAEADPRFASGMNQTLAALSSLGSTISLQRLDR
jgi:hypothetical protein